MTTHPESSSAFTPGRHERGDFRRKEHDGSANLARQRAAELLGDARQSFFTREMISDEQFTPVDSIEVDGKDVLFSGIAENENGRRFCIVYVPDETTGTVVPRMGYKSVSDGGWRISPCFQGRFISKGAEVRVDNSPVEHREFGGYAQVTKPHELIDTALMNLEQDYDASAQIKYVSGATYEEKFSELNQMQGGVQSTRMNQDVRASAVGDESFEAYVSGRGFPAFFHPRFMRAQLNELQLPEGMQPNFDAAPERSYTMEHTLLGECVVEVYHGRLPDGTAARWHMARTRDNSSVWVDKIVRCDARMSSFGTYDKVVVGGVLSAKPVDYIAQMGNMERGKDFIPLNSTYASVQPVLDRTPWIRAYRASFSARDTAASPR